MYIYIYIYICICMICMYPEESMQIVDEFL